MEDFDQDFKQKFDQAVIAEQETCDQIPTYWVSKDRIVDILRYFKQEVERPYRMLYDLTAIDERAGNIAMVSPTAISPWFTSCFLLTATQTYA